MGIRRYIIALRSALPNKVLQEGEKPVLLEKGENPVIDAFCREILHLPEKTQVFHCTTSKIIPPIEFIGGRETRPVGDTCRMFYKIKQEGRTADYLFWDGIVPSGLNELGERPTEEFQEIIEEMSGVYLPSTYGNDDIGLATGRSSYRIVLFEKIKKAPRSGEPRIYPHQMM
jgi:hypothetical protein